MPVEAMKPAGPVLAGALVRPALASVVWLAAVAGLTALWLAQPSGPAATTDLWGAWDFSPSLWLSLGLSAWCYLRGAQHLARQQHRLALWRVVSFAGGLLAIALALISPLDALAAQLFSAHMAQHVLLLLVAAPLLALSRPLGPLMLGLPVWLRRELGRRWQRAAGVRQVWHGLNHPVVAWGLPAGALWAWHMPALYLLALHNPLVHALEHLCFTLSALLFWWCALHPARRQALGHGVSALMLFTSGLQSSVLAVLLTFSPRPWYAGYSLSPTAWGLSALQDQQVAGAVMWVPAAAVYLAGVIGVLAAWLRQMDQTPARPAAAWYPVLEGRGELKGVTAD